MGQWLSSSVSVSFEDPTVIHLRLQIVYHTTADVIDSSNSFSVTGSWPNYSGATSINIDTPVGSGGSQLIYDQTIVVAKQYGVTQTASYAASLTGINYWGASQVIYTSGSRGIAARPYELPAAPTGISVARTSDTSHAISWKNTNPGSGSAPYHGISVERWDNVSGVWSAIASLGVVTSYTDTTTVANRKYQYRVKATNSRGSSGYSTSGAVYTTPAGPTSASAAKSGSDIIVTWAGVPSYTEHETLVYDKPNGGAEVLVGTVAAGTTIFTHTAPNASQTHQYVVRHRSTVTPALVSAAATTGIVQLLTTPNAPTNLGPTTARPATESVTLVWQHNPVDTTAQTKYQLRRRKVGAGSWTVGSEVVSDTSSATLTPSSAWGAANGEAWEWQVRTWGEYATGSPWSATSTIPFSARPTVLVNSPADGAVVDRSKTSVVWGYADAEGAAQAAWSVKLYAGTGAGKVLRETKTGVGAQTTVQLDTLLPDGTSWTLEVQVQDADGVWSAVSTTTFTVDYAEPPQPVITGEWDPGQGIVVLDILTPGPVSPQPAADHVNVYRSMDQGTTWDRIASDLDPNTVLVDRTPPLVGQVIYLAEAVSDLPSATVSAELTVQLGGADSVFISAGPGMSLVCRTGSAPSVTEQGGRVKVLRRFAGRARPVEFTGEFRERILTLNAVLVPGVDSDPEDWLALSDLPGPHLWRDPDGRYVWVSLGAPNITRAMGGTSHQLTLTATEVDR